MSIETLEKPKKIESKQEDMNDPIELYLGILERSKSLDTNKAQIKTALDGLKIHLPMRRYANYQMIQTTIASIEGAINDKDQKRFEEEIGYLRGHIIRGEFLKQESSKK